MFEVSGAAFCHCKRRNAFHINIYPSIDLSTFFPVSDTAYAAEVRSK